MSKSVNSYKTLIPKGLHHQVEGLLAYLECFPLEKPSSCPYCDSKSFYSIGSQQRPDLKLIRYLCNYCGKSFTQLSNTIFHRTYDLEKWVDIARLHLSGLTKQEVAKATATTHRMVVFRCKAIEQHMQKEYPRLYTWWSKHQNRDDLAFTETVQKQATLFLDWLHERIVRRDYACPKCNKQMLKSSKTDLRPLFVCNGCRVYHNALSDTRLKGLLQIHFWIPFTLKLIEGYGSNDIVRLTNIKRGAAMSWRPVFIAQMRDLGLNELVQWIEWQRNRRCAQVLKINRWLNNFAKGLDDPTDASAS